MAGSQVVNAVGPSYHLSDRKAGVETAVNCYPQKTSGGNWMLAPTPGLSSYSDVGPWRGSKAIDDRWFLVGGSTLWEVNQAGALTSRGTLATSEGHVGIAVNESQVAIVDGPNLYIYNYLTHVFSTVMSAGWRGSDDVYELDGYFVFVDPDSDEFYISAIDDGTSLDVLDFSSADSSPDSIITHRVSHRQLWLFGKSNSTEIWVNSGDAAFPFTRYQSYTVDIGCVGKRAAINAADTLFFVGKTDRGTGIVYMVQGNQPKRVSNLAVEQSLRSSTDLTSLWMWTYQTEGHEFIGIEAPGLDKTWVYDAATDLWHERGEWSDGWAPMGFQFVTYFAIDSGATPGLLATHWAGSSDRNDLYRFSDTTYTLYNRTLMRERTWPHLMQESMEPISYRGLELAMATGPSTTAEVTLEVSNDGGHTFGPPLLKTLGATGRFMQRVRWLGLGTAINRVFRIRMSDPVPFALHSATVDT